MQGYVAGYASNIIPVAQYFILSIKTQMENTEIREQWPQIKSKLAAKYPHLTEEELKYEIGKEGELLERLQEKLGKNWEEIKGVLSLMGG